MTRRKPSPFTTTPKSELCIRCEAPAVTTYAGQPICETCAKEFQ